MAAEVSDEQFRLLCLLHLAEEAMRETLCHFVKNQTLTQKKKASLTTDPYDAGVALAEIFNFIPPTALGEIESRFHRTSTKVYNAIFTNTAGSTAASSSSQKQYIVNPTINLELFDISALHYLLTSLDLSFLPTRKAQFRKRDGGLGCLDPAHLKKCCNQCESSGGRMHGKNLLPCKSCSKSHYQCYNEHTPCCTQCNSCDFCAASAHTTCINRKLRHAISFLHNVRNLNAHSNQQTYNDLKTGTFVDVELPGCNGWNILWSKSSIHLLELLYFLQANNVIDQPTYFTRCYEITTKIPNQTKNELSSLYGNALLGLCDEFTRMISGSLEESVSEISLLKDKVSNLEKALSLPKCFNIKFLLHLSNVGKIGYWNMLNNFLVLKDSLKREDLSLRSEFSRKLSKYIETILAGFLSDCGSFMVILDNIEYKEIERGYLYKFVVSPRQGANIPDEWYQRILEDEQGMKVIQTEVERCITDAISAEKCVQPNVHVFHITYGSIIFTCLIGQLFDADGVELDPTQVIEGCWSQFSHDYLQMSSIRRMDSSSHGTMSCDFRLHVIGKSEYLNLCVESGITHVHDQVRGPPGAPERLEIATRRQGPSLITYESKGDQEKHIKEDESKLYHENQGQADSQGKPSTQASQPGSSTISVESQCAYEVVGDIRRDDKPKEILDDAPLRLKKKLEPVLSIVRQPKTFSYGLRHHRNLLRGQTKEEENLPIYPMIKISNYRGRAGVVVTLVTVDDEGQDPHLHAHSLVVNGKVVTKGFHVFDFPRQNPKLEFADIEIQCAQMEDLESTLIDRILQTQFLQKNGWSAELAEPDACLFSDLVTYTNHLEKSPKPLSGHTKDLVSLKKDATNLAKIMDLTKSRLCFQAYCQDDNGKISRKLEPVYSEVIDIDTGKEVPLIQRISKMASTTAGNDEVWIACEEIPADDIEVRFFETVRTTQFPKGWEAFATFEKTDVSMPHLLICKTPAYHDKNIKESVDVFLHLRKKSDPSRFSNAIQFKYLPCENFSSLRRKFVPPQEDEDAMKKQRMDDKFLQSSSSTRSPLKKPSVDLQRKLPGNSNPLMRNINPLSTSSSPTSTPAAKPTTSTMSVKDEAKDEKPDQK